MIPIVFQPALQAVADTLVTVAARDPLGVAVDVAILVMAVGVGVLAFLGAWVLRRVNRQVAGIRRTVEGNLGPAADRARSIADNVDFITAALRTDVQRLNASIKALSGRLNQASDRMEERIEEFNALMELVQSEAEGIFLDTAATVRGVREGARTLAGDDKTEVDREVVAEAAQRVEDPGTEAHPEATPDVGMPPPPADDPGRPASPPATRER